MSIPRKESTFFLLILNILTCNSIDILDGNYEGISQDELCFLKSVKRYGYEILERNNNHLKLKIGDRTMRAEIVHTVDFTSKRQCMCTLVKYDGRYYLFSKGSDQRLLDPRVDAVLLHMLGNASDYRSLVMKCIELTAEEVDEIMGDMNGMHPARMEDSSGRITKAIDAYQPRMAYLGTTFIEDELQDDVEDTMEVLRRAGMKIWMITGDKRETAISCARNSKVLTDEGTYREIEGKFILEEMEQMLARGTSDSGSSEQMNLFDYDSVIIYRTTPSQKGKIAALMIQADKHILAIGDGNNDVAMLKDAHVGVGIMGREGTQASLAADFAIPQFRYLKHLVLLHGRYNLIRYSKVSLNAYYKNLAFIFIQFFFNFFNSASGRSIYNNFFLNYYNLFFTSLLPFSIALFDRDKDPAAVLAQPETYRHARQYFTLRMIYANIVFAIVEAAVLFFGTFAAVYLDITGSSGKLGGYMCISTLFSLLIFGTVLLRQFRIMSFMVLYSYLAMALSVFFIIIVLFGIQELSADTNSIIFHLLAMPVFYFILSGIACVVYLMDTVFDYLQDKLMKSKGN